MGKVLSGLTVAVTRPRAQAAGLARGLRACGARVVVAPAIRVAPPASSAGLDAALRGLAGYDAAVFTSRNAVEALFARARALRLPSPPPPALVYAVGPETAAALRRRGWRPRRLAGTYRGAALAGVMKGVRGLKVLLPRARDGAEDLPRLLRRAGARLAQVEAYRTLPDLDSMRRLKRSAPRLDAVAFASPSAARAFVAGLGLHASRRLFKRAAAASIGPVTSAALRELGIPPAVEARRATARELLAALKRHYGRKA